MSTPLVAGLACPINLNPSSLIIKVGMRDDENPGRLSFGLIINPKGGIIESSDGLELDPCFVKEHQHGKKVIHVFSPGLVYTSGINSGSGNGNQ